jgi:hypothetical protein
MAAKVPLIPAKAGIQSPALGIEIYRWVSACAGTSGI